MEIKRKEVSIQVHSEDFNTQKTIKIKIDNQIAQELCILLLLLKESLINTLELKFTNFIFFIDSKIDDPCVYTIIDFKKRVFKGTLSENSLEYIIFFLLKYYRDGIGEAEHIDIDFKNKTGVEVTLTFLCDNYLEYSADDMNRMLG